VAVADPGDLCRRSDQHLSPGDGIGKEVVPEGMRVLEAAPGGTGWTRVFDLDLREVDGADGRFIRFQRGPSHGLVRVTYREGGGGLEILVRPLRSAPGLEQVTIANEQSGRFDDYADASGARSGEAVGSVDEAEEQPAIRPTRRCTTVPSGSAGMGCCRKSRRRSSHPGAVGGGCRTTHTRRSTGRHSIPSLRSSVPRTQDK